MIELASIIVLGILAQWIAWRLRVPAILPLIIIGLLAGAGWQYMYGFKLIDPIFHEVPDPESPEYSFFGTNERGLFGGQSLFYFVSLAIGIILFEGGLTLKRAEIKDVGPAIVKLILIGSAITFVGAGVAAHYIMGMGWAIAFLFAGLIIVTGPTVIAPILRNIPLNPNVATVLKWEGILIDPLGALVAVLVFDFIIAGESLGAFTVQALIEFLKIVVVGLAVGFAAAIGLYQLIKKEMVPHYLLNVFTLALVLLIFAGSDYLAHESGLLSVVVMGMVLGNLEVPYLKDILDFKESLSVLLISVLFILLSANIDIDDLRLLSTNAVWLFLAVVFLLRPLGVFLSTVGSSLNVREKLFISWVGPRGIVAAGIASLFGLKLTSLDTPVEGAQYITPLVFMIVLGTVLLNATTARVLAKLLRIVKAKSDGILIVGAHAVARLLARYLKANGRHVVLVDNSATNIKYAEQEGIKAIKADIYREELVDKIDLLDMGYLVAMTSNADVNETAIKKLKFEFGENGTFRLITPREMRNAVAVPDQGLLSYHDDYINMSEVVRDYPDIHEMSVDNAEELSKAVANMNVRSNSIPVLLKDPDGTLHFLPRDPSTMVVTPSSSLVYLGKQVLPPAVVGTSNEEELV